MSGVEVQKFTWERDGLVAEVWQRRDSRWKWRVYPKQGVKNARTWLGGSASFSVPTYDLALDTLKGFLVACGCLDLLAVTHGEPHKSEIPYRPVDSSRCAEELVVTFDVVVDGVTGALKRYGRWFERCGQRVSMPDADSDKFTEAAVKSLQDAYAKKSSTPGVLAGVDMGKGESETVVSVMSRGEDGQYKVVGAARVRKDGAELFDLVGDVDNALVLVKEAHKPEENRAKDPVYWRTAKVIYDYPFRLPDPIKVPYRYTFCGRLLDGRDCRISLVWYPFSRGEYYDYRIRASMLVGGWSVDFRRDSVASAGLYQMCREGLRRIQVEWKLPEYKLGSWYQLGGGDQGSEVAWEGQEGCGHQVNSAGQCSCGFGAAHRGPGK